MRRILVLTRPKHGITIPYLELGTKLLHQFGLKPDSQIRVRVGLYELPTKICLGRPLRARRYPLARLTLPEPAAKTLGFAVGRPLAGWINQRVLIMGPVIGILTEHRPNADTQTPFGAQTGSFQGLCRVAADMGAIVFGFTPQDVDWDRGCLYGYMYARKGDGKRRWVRSAVPWPTMVYNRLSTRRAEQSRAANTVKSRLLSQYQIPVVNPGFLDKWSVQLALERSASLARYLPETRRLTGPRDLAYLLAKYGNVYLKRISGSLGLGTMEVHRCDKGYAYRYNIAERRSIEGTVSTFSRLFLLVRRLTASRPYVVQQGIQLAQFEGRPFDIRVLVQKQMDGQWHMTGAACRVAGRGQITTHVPMGGTRKSFARVLNHTFGDLVDVEQKRRELGELARQAALALESYTQATYAELSLDVGMDQRGHFAIFEMNAKPFRFDEPKIREQAWRNLVEYAGYMAGVTRSS